MRELTVDMFSTVDGYGSGGPRPVAYWGYGTPGLFARPSFAACSVNGEIVPA